MNCFYDLTAGMSNVDFYVKEDWQNQLLGKSTAILNRSFGTVFLQEWLLAHW